MQDITDHELTALDAFARETDGLGFLATLEGVLALCRAYPALSAEVQRLRQVAQRHAQHVNLANTETVQLRAENRMLSDRVAALEAQVRARATAAA